MKKKSKRNREKVCVVDRRTGKKECFVPRVKAKARSRGVGTSDCGCGG